MSRITFIVSALTVLIAVGAGLAGCDRGAKPSGKPIIVATTYPLASIVEQIVGDAADVRCIIPPGVSPHGFEPTSEDAEAIAQAKAVVLVGGGFDEWVLGKSPKRGKDGPVIIAMAEPAEHDHHDHGHGHGHDHGHEHHHHEGANPHIWLDPVRMAEFAHHLSHDLMPVFSETVADEIHNRAHELEEEIETIDAEYRKALAPIADKKIITFHDAFDVMAARYKIEVAATLMPPELTGTLTRARIEQAIEAVRKHRLGVIYTEPQFPAEAGDVLRREAGVKVLTLDPLGDPAVPQRATYQKMMRYNLETLVKGFAIEPEPSE